MGDPHPQSESRTLLHDVSRRSTAGKLCAVVFRAAGDEWTVIILLTVVPGDLQPPCICRAELETWGQELCGG